MGVSFELRPTGRDLTRITRELRKMDDRELLKRFRKELRQAAKPVVPAVRASIRQIPSKRPYSPEGLRGQMARATGLQVKTSGRQAAVVIRVDGRKMPSGARAIPAYMEGTRPRWRHPVYGHRDTWVQQPSHPYFYKVTRAAGVRARAGVTRVINGVTRDIR